MDCVFELWDANVSTPAPLITSVQSSNLSIKVKQHYYNIHVTTCCTLAQRETVEKEQLQCNEGVFFPCSAAENNFHRDECVSIESGSGS